MIEILLNAMILFLCIFVCMAVISFSIAAYACIKASKDSFPECWRKSTKE